MGSFFTAGFTFAELDTGRAVGIFRLGARMDMLDM